MAQLAAAESELFTRSRDFRAEEALFIAFVQTELVSGMQDGRFNGFVYPLSVLCCTVE